MERPLERIALRWPDDAAERWAADQCVVLPGCVPPAQAAVWELAARQIVSRPKTVGTDRSTDWHEQGFLGDLLVVPCGGIARDRGFLEAVRTVTGFAGFDELQTMAWINRYVPGDRVPEHTDQGGDCQFLVCLQAPPPDGGGVLHVAGRPVPLGRGDAVLWSARTRPHAMSELTTDVVGPSGAARVVFVVRLFAAEAGAA